MGQMDWLHFLNEGQMAGLTGSPQNLTGEGVFPSWEATLWNLCAFLKEQE